MTLLPFGGFVSLQAHLLGPWSRTFIIGFTVVSSTPRPPFPRAFTSAWLALSYVLAEQANCYSPSLSRPHYLLCTLPLVNSQLLVP